MIQNETDFPETWEFPELGAVSEVRYGLGQPPQLADDGVPMIRATNVKRGRISPEGLIRIKRSAIPESRNPYLKATDVVVVRSGAYTGDVALVTERWAGSVAGYDLVVSPGTAVDPAFCAYALLSQSVQQHFKGQSNRAAQAHLNRQQLQTTQVPIPPLPEQKKIAHILSTVQRAIEAQERIIQATTELKKALMHKLFTEGLRNEPQKQTEIGFVPESWEVVQIGDLGKCVTGSTPKTKVASFYDPPSEDFIAPADLGARRYVYDSEKKISREGMVTIRPLPRNAVMCVCIGSSIGKVGMSYREESATNQQINSIICKKGRDAEFVYYLLSYHREYWKSFATFGPVPILSKGRFTTIAVAIPSAMEDQQAVAKPLVALEARVEVAERKIAALQDLFRTLLHELMTAKTRVHELEATA